MIDNYLIYIGLAVSITTIPGPAVILTIKNSIKYGPKTAIANIFGNMSAMVTLASVSAAGLGAIILASSRLFSAMKIAGCLYLIYLGYKTLRSPVESSESDEPEGRVKETASFFQVYKTGLGVGLSNPKAIAFFTALFPQFINPERTFLPQFATLILTIEGISFLVLSTYAMLAGLASAFLSRRRSMIAFNRLSAAAFFGFGLALIAKD
jgi:threonine/homoserine/homoserine lactone efflux protein